MRGYMLHTYLNVVIYEAFYTNYVHGQYILFHCMPVFLILLVSGKSVHMCVKAVQYDLCSYVDK